LTAMAVGLKRLNRRMAVNCITAHVLMVIAVTAQTYGRRSFISIIYWLVSLVDPSGNRPFA